MKCLNRGTISVEGWFKMDAIVSEWGRKAHIGILDDGLAKANCKSRVYGVYKNYENSAISIDELLKELIDANNEVCSKCFKANKKVGA